MQASGGAGADGEECPQSILHAPCALSQDVRRALWCGVREYGTSWRKIRQNYPACADMEERKLAYFVKRLGIVEAIRLRGGLNCEYFSLRFVFLSLKHAAFSALQHSMPTRTRMLHLRSPAVHLLCL